MRTVSTTVMALLVVAALFWGNCFSCPQILLASQKHGCCPHTKSSNTECKTQGLKNFVKADTASAPAPVIIAFAAPPAPEFTVVAAPTPRAITLSPPELMSLRR